MPAPGYIPHPIAWKDILRRIVGEPNLGKRLQWDDIFQALALTSDDIALDLGCGSGYMTYTMARQCRKAYGVDVLDVEKNIIPRELSGKLEFCRSHGERTPFPDAMFDVVLMSEVVPMIPDPSFFFEEVSRILKPTGRIVLVNPLERRTIRRDYENNSFLIRLMQVMGNAPRDYDDYTERLQNSFGTALKYLPPQSYYQATLNDVGFYVESLNFSPSAAAQGLCERLQFIALCMGWRTIGKRYFVLYPLFWLIDRIASQPRGSGCIMVARRHGHAAA